MILDFICAISLLSGYILTGNEKRIGWLFSLIGNCGYIYILSDSNYKGLLVLSVLMAVVCIYNFFKWKSKKE